MKRYNSYHTIVKQLVRRNNLPCKYLDQINRSTMWRWKQEKEDKYLGYELCNIEILEEFINRREAQKVMSAYLKIACSVSNILAKTRYFHNTLRDNLAIFIKSILRYQDDINIKLLLRLCKVPLSVFYYWKDLVLKNCNSSPLKLCRRTYPGQLTNGEVSEMKSLLQDDRFRFWPVCSIAYYALRENLLSVSLSTWYFYRKKLNIVRSAIPKKIKYSTGIFATRPNQIWHADITIVKTKDNIKHYVYLLMDNFSKYVLSWRIEPYVSGKVRVDTIREAYNKYVRGSHPVILVTDGGQENDNNEMMTYVDSEGISINLLIAQKDIPFSNSLIEAQNRLFKYGYLFRQEYNNYYELVKVFGYDVIDYNDIRPHISLKGHTPAEVYKGLNRINEQWSEQMDQARKNRLLENRRAICEICK